MKIPVSVRHATIEDAADMARLHVLTWRAAYRDILSANFLHKTLDIADQMPGWKIEIAKTLKPDARSHIMLADTREHGLQGFVIFGPGREGVIPSGAGPNYKLGQIYSLYVMPDFLKHGLGKAMLNTAFEVLRKEKCTEVYLTTFEANVTAQRFYERQGGINPGVVTSTEIDGKNVPSRAYRWSLGSPGF